MTSPDPKSWIGRTETYVDAVDAGHIEKVALSLDAGVPGVGADVPMLWHWALFIKALPYDQLGEDGHPKRGGFLPPADDRNRMWAGGRLDFLRPLQVGTPARRVSTVAAVIEKQGRTGKLLFVTVKHEYSQGDVPCITEEQDIVYREPSPPKLTGTESAPIPAQWSETITPTPVSLFRYSAVTYNGHRIHYDEPYATGTEGYSGLVVHGPLIATLMCTAFLRANPGKVATHLSYRGLRPLCVPTPFEVAGACVDHGSAQLWAAQNGTLAHRAELKFKA